MNQQIGLSGVISERRAELETMPRLSAATKNFAAENKQVLDLNLTHQ